MDTICSVAPVGQTVGRVVYVPGDEEEVERCTLTCTVHGVDLIARKVSQSVSLRFSQSVCQSVCLSVCLAGFNPTINEKRKKKMERKKSRKGNKRLRARAGNLYTVDATTI